MSKKKTIIILGAGNGGQAIAAILSLRGYEVILYDRYEEAILPIWESGGIELMGVSMNGFAHMKRVTTNLQEALSQKGLILVVLPAFAHSYIAEKIAPLLNGDEIIVLFPGSTGGAFEFRRILNEQGAPKVKLAETNSLIYACRIVGPAKVKIMGVKEQLGIAALPAKDTPIILEHLKEIYPQLYPERDVLSTGLNNLNPIFHVYPTLSNMGWIEATHGNFRFYYDGMTPSVAKLVEALDRERIALCLSFGVPAISAIQWQKKIYKAKGRDLPEVIRSNPSYEEIQAPNSIESRLLTEDVPMGLVPMAEIAKIANLPTPFMDCAILLASEILGRDCRRFGRNLEAMGISGLNKEQLLHLLREEEFTINSTV